jgi:hypothetical protein
LLVILSRMRCIALLLALPSLALAAPAVAGPDCNPAEAVRGYFQALDRQDFSRALALTDGAAQTRTWRMVDTLQHEAQAHHARVEVKVKALDVRPPGAAEPGRGVPVPVQFHIDVVGHAWCFHKVARTFDGSARFWVDPARAHRIIAIEGEIE